MIAEFYTKVFGLFVGEVIEHELVGRGFALEWMDSCCTKQLLTGVVLECRQIYGESPRFVVQFSENTGSEEMGDFPNLQDFDERSAYGGCLFFEDMMSKFSSSSKKPTNKPVSRDSAPPHPIIWYTAERVIDSTNSRTLIFGPWRISLKVDESSIKGANLGMKIKVEPMHPGIPGLDVLTLPKGHMLDLGVYAPLRPSDRVPYQVFLLKNFLYDFAPEAYCFEPSIWDRRQHPADSILDITDKNGKLHELAAVNVLPRVNEPSDDPRIDQVTLQVQYTPNGEVHYMLGLQNEAASVLRVKADGNWREGTVDYGPLYERSRVRAGYSKAPSSERKKVEEDIANDDIHVLLSFRGLTTRQLRECLAYLEDLSEESSLDELVLSKMLLVSCILLTVAQSIEQKKNEGGETSNDDQEETEESLRAKKLIRGLTDSLGEGTAFKELLQSKVYGDFACPILKVGCEELENITTSDLRGKLLDLCT